MARPWLKLLPAAILVIVAVWEVVRTVRAGDDVPGDAAWAEAAAAVRARHAPGDLIVFAPDWVDPVGRMHLGDLITLEQAGRMDAARFGTIWELSIRGARASETRGLTTADVISYGGVVVRRFERTPATVTAALVDRLAGARTDGRRAAGPSVVLAEVGFTPRRCVQVTPAPDASVRVTFPAVPLGTTLVGYAGLADVFKRREITAPARLDVELDGRVAATVTLTNASGWSRFEVATQPGPRDVTIVATALGAGARDRQVCFAAEARP
ncbi:MAG: hypothetical protein R2939_10770 [Kofleriaceae bacterium]